MIGVGGGGAGIELGPKIVLLAKLFALCNLQVNFRHKYDLMYKYDLSSLLMNIIYRPYLVQ